MEPPKLRTVYFNRNSVYLSWAPEPILRSSPSTSSLLQKSPRQSRMALFSEDKKLSRSSLAASPDLTGRKNVQTPPLEPREDVLDSPDFIWQTDEWYTLQQKDRVLGWTTVYWGFINEIEITPLAPGEVYRFRVNRSTDDETSEWSETLSVATKDDIVSAASLHRALENGHIPSARRVITLRPQAIEIPNRMGRTAVAIAASKADINMTSMLLLSGADVNTREAGSFRTPLMTANFGGTMNLINLLKERDASWDLTDRFGQTALHYAAMNSQLHAIHLSSKEVGNVNARDSYGWTPLMHAVTLGATQEAIECLIKSGCNVNAHDCRGQSVLMQAILSGQPAIVQLLLKSGANKEHINNHGHSAYDFAKTSSNKEMLDLLPLLDIGQCSSTEVEEELP